VYKVRVAGGSTEISGHLIGQTVAHYKILQKIGSGGMGEVYLAEDINLDRQVALKVLPPALANDTERRGIAQPHRVRPKTCVAPSNRHRGGGEHRENEPQRHKETENLCIRRATLTGTRGSRRYRAADVSRGSPLARYGLISRSAGVR